MAIVFQDKGDYEKALEWYQRALDGHEKTLGKNYPDTLITVQNMAIVFQKKGEYDKALEWYQRALDGKEKDLGKDHPSTLLTVHNIAVVFRFKGEYEKTFELSQRALDGHENALGNSVVHEPSGLESFESGGASSPSPLESARVSWRLESLGGRRCCVGAVVVRRE